jgi:NTP pyrophosphatase (non-canonical NTP hydrolase)
MKEQQGFMSIFGLQGEVREWSRQVTPDATPDTCMAHIKEEVAELENELALLAHERFNSAGVEAADVVILLCALACLLDIDLANEVEQKWQIVKGRVYNKGADGVYRHEVTK